MTAITVEIVCVLTPDDCERAIRIDGAWYIQARAFKTARWVMMTTGHASKARALKEWHRMLNSATRSYFLAPERT